MYISDSVHKFFKENEKELAEIGITGGAEVDLSVLLIAINFHRRLKKLEAEHDKGSSFRALNQT